MTDIFSDEGKMRIVHLLGKYGLSVKDMRDRKTQVRISARVTDDKVKMTRKEKERAMRSVKALGNTPFVDTVGFMMKSPNIGKEVVYTIAEGKKGVSFSVAPVVPKSASQRY